MQQKYSIWIEHQTGFGGSPCIVIYKEDEENNNSKPVMEFELHDPDGTIALSNGVLIEYHLVTESFGIMFAPNGNTHIYRDGDSYAIFTEDELEWVVAAPDAEMYTWIMRD